MKFALKFALSAVAAQSIAAAPQHLSPEQGQSNQLEANQKYQEAYEQAAGFEPQKTAFKSSVEPTSFFGYDGQAIGGDHLSADASDGTYAVAPAGPYGGVVPYYNYDPSPFQYEQGADEYLMPQMPSSAMESDETGDTGMTDLFNPLADSMGISDLLPESTRQLVELARRSLSMFTTLIGATIFGGSVTTALCTFTPLCTISFALPFIGVRSGLRRVAETLRFGEAQTNHLMQATELVETAIRKMQTLQKAGQIQSAVKQTEPEATLIESSDKVGEKSVADKAAVAKEA